MVDKECKKRNDEGSGTSSARLLASYDSLPSFFSSHHVPNLIKTSLVSASSRDRRRREEKEENKKQPALSFLPFQTLHRLHEVLSRMLPCVFLGRSGPVPGSSRHPSLPTAALGSSTMLRGCLVVSFPLLLLSGPSSKHAACWGGAGVLHPSASPGASQ